MNSLSSTKTHIDGAMQIPAATLDQFKALLGPKGYIDDPDDVHPWLTDWRGRFHGRSEAILAPASVEEVAETVRLASDFGVSLVPQGGNTSMVGGATPSEDGNDLILSLRRLNAIRTLDAAKALAVVEAGVVLETLHDAARQAGMRFPLTLGARGSATIGGLISTNAGGTQVLRFGTMRGLTLGLEAVLPDGSVFHGLDALKKDNRGYDLKQLLIGAEGTLGIVTAASLRIVPAIVDRAVAWIGLDSPQKALDLLHLFEKWAGTELEGFEIVPNHTLGLVLQHIPGTRAPLDGQYAWHTLVEVVRDDPAKPAPGEALEAALAVALERAFIRDAVIASSEAQAEAFWRLRDSISEAERASGPAVQHDISVPVAQMPDFMIDAALAVERNYPGVCASAFGHLGDGNVHFHVRAPSGATPAWVNDAGHAISAFVYDLVVAAGGSISAEHGIGQMKLDDLIRLTDPARLQAQSAIKRALDPGNIMNPGKLVPLATKPPSP